MTPTQFSQRLLQAEPDSPDIAALARDLVEGAHYPAYSILQHSLSSLEPEEKMKSRNVLAELGELALFPLSKSARWPDIATELWTMRTVAAELVSFRRRTAAVLKNLLSNDYLAPVAQGPLAAQLPPNLRVADLAFVQLHRMLHIDLSLAAFLGMPPSDRDNQIEQFQESPAFRHAFESQS